MSFIFKSKAHKYKVEKIKHQLDEIYWNYEIMDPIKFISIIELVDDKKNEYGIIRPIGENQDFFIWGFRSSVDIKRSKKERKKNPLLNYHESIFRQSKKDISNVVYLGRAAPDTKVFCDKLISLSGGHGFFIDCVDIYTGEASFIERKTKNAFGAFKFKTFNAYLRDKEKEDTALSVVVIDNVLLYIIGKDEKWKTYDVSKPPKHSNILFEILILPSLSGKGFDIYNSLDDSNDFDDIKISLLEKAKEYQQKQITKRLLIKELQEEYSNLPHLRNLDEIYESVRKIITIETELGIKTSDNLFETEAETDFDEIETDFDDETNCEIQNEEISPIVSEAVIPKQFIKTGTNSQENNYIPKH